MYGLFLKGEAETCFWQLNLRERHTAFPVGHVTSCVLQRVTLEITLKSSYPVNDARLNVFWCTQPVLRLMRPCEGDYAGTASDGQITKHGTDFS